MGVARDDRENMKLGQVKSSHGATHSHSELSDPNVFPPQGRGL